MEGDWEFLGEESLSAKSKQEFLKTGSKLSNQSLPWECFEYFWNNNNNWNKYIVLDVSVCSITVYFYQLCRILTSLYGKSKCKQQVKICMGY